MRPFDAQGAFHPEVDGKYVRRLAVRGAGATILSSGIALVIQMLATVVLARLIAPADFGLVALVTTVSLLFVNFGLNGFTEAVIQREEITHDLASNLFWITLGGGLLLTIGFAKAGSLLASFYHNPRVAHITAPISLSIVLTSLSVLHLALLKRAMRFASVSANDVVARAVSVLVSIVMGVEGLGYWALIAGVLAQPIVTALGAFYLCRWSPGFPRRAEGTSAMVQFAANTYGRFSINYFARNVDNLLVGWRFGAFSLGFYKKAYDLFALTASQTTAPLTNVAVSALSRFHPRSIEYRKHLLGALSVLAFLGMALSAEFTLVGNHLIRVLLGRGWEPAGRIFTFFGPGIGMMVIYHMHGWIHLSIGKADRWLRWGIVEVAVTCGMFLLALPWGADGVAAAWTVSFWVLTLPAFVYAGRPIRLGVRPIIGAVWKYAVAATFAGCVTFEIMRRVPALFKVSTSLQAAILQLVVISSVFAALYAGIIVVLYRSTAPFRQLGLLIREVLSGRGAGQKRAENRASTDAEIACSAISENSATEWSSVAAGH